MLQERSDTPGRDGTAEPQADGGTTRPETPALEGRTPLPEEITGMASGTDEDLVTLFRDPGGAHLADGFRGGSEDEPAESEAPRGRPAR